MSATNRLGRPDWTDVVSALTSMTSVAMGAYALFFKFPEWTKERRTVQRSQIATNALVAADAPRLAMISSFKPDIKISTRADGSSFAS